MGDFAFSLWHSCCFFSSSFFSNSLSASLWLFFKCLHRLYGALFVSKFNNTLDTRDISFWCTNFSGGVQILGYKFWCTNFREVLLIQGGGHKLPGGVQISRRGTYLGGIKISWRRIYFNTYFGNTNYISCRTIFCVGPFLVVQILSLVPRPHPLTRKGAWWPLSDFLVVPNQQSWYWTTLCFSFGKVSNSCSWNSEFSSFSNFFVYQPSLHQSSLFG